MKLYSLLFGLASVVAAQAQNVGINQNSPTNSLHISPVNTGNDPLRIDGMQSYVSGDTTLMIIDNSNGIVRYVAKSDLGSMIGNILFQDSDFTNNLNTYVTNNTSSDTDVDSARVVGNTLQIFENGTMVTADLTNVTGTTYTGGTGIGISGSTITNTAPDQTVAITGTGGTTVTGTYPNFTINSSTGSSYTAGTGIGISGGTISNTAPDQTVTIAGTGNTTVTGTYPNFSIASTDNQTLGSNSTSITLTNGGSVPFGSINAKDWHTNGNAGTNGPTDFLGTTDSKPLVFKTNSLERMRIANSGRVSVNSTSGFSTSVFHSAATATDDAITAASNGTGQAIYAQNSSSGISLMAVNTGTGTAAYLQASNATKQALSARNLNALGTGVISSGNNVLANYLISGTGGAFTGDDGSYSKSTNTSGTGVIGLGNNLANSTTYTTGTGGAFSGNDGMYAVGKTTSGTGVIGAGNNLSASSSLVVGSGGAFTGTSIGVYGKANNTSGSSIWGVGVYGDGAQYGVFSQTTLGANGTKSFIIDHPLDPENKFLKHYSMESPEVINFYRGNIILNANGEAIVELPDYFTAININYSYTLTPIGSYSDTYIAEEIDDTGKFKIAGGNPNQKISWYVYAERNDANVTMDPFYKAVVVEKSSQQKGKYLNPKAHGKTKEYALFQTKETESIEKESLDVEVVPTDKK